jgi:hypothetical protein
MKTYLGEVAALRLVISILIGAAVALVPSLADWLWTQSAFSIASAYVLLPGGVVSRILGFRLDAPFMYCATIASAIFYAALVYILLCFRKIRPKKEKLDIY